MGHDVSRFGSAQAGAYQGALARAPLRPARLLEYTGALLEHRDRGAEAILGSLDAAKGRSSMTLFHRADPDEPLFAAVLDRFYGGAPDALTDELLRAGRD